MINSMEMWMAYAMILPVLVGWLLWWWNEIWYVRPVKARCAASDTKMPPGHLGFPLFGETLSFLWLFNVASRPDDFVSAKKSKYGENVGIYRTHLYGAPSIIACSPALCKLVLTSSDKFIQEWPTTEVLGANSLITLHEGPRHTAIKSHMLKYLSRPNSLSWIVLQIQPSIVAALQSWSQQPSIKSVDHVKKVTLDYTMRYTTRLEAGAEIDTIERQFEDIVRGFRAQPWNIPGTTFYNAVKSRRNITKRLRAELEKRKQQQTKNSTSESEETALDLMDGLRQMKDEDGNYLSDEAVLDNVVSTILVGHISIAHSLTWSLRFLSNTPHVLEKLREENMAMFKEKGTESITYEDITKLKYTNKVAEETIRLANLSAFVFRKATDDIEFKGYIIPKGWNVIVWLRELHTDPRNFKDPLSFNPDRWDERPKPGTYHPFGGGPRSCLGSSLVKVSLVLFLHHLSIGYKWELLNPGAKIRYISHPVPTDGQEISIRKI